VLPAHLLSRKTSIQAEILGILAEEELYWHKRSNSKWLLQGDNNTNFFHRIANGKRRKNKILSLINNDVVIEEENLLVEHATDYY